MFHVMFDVDGTLVQAYPQDDENYVQAVYEVLGHHISSDWSKYVHASDAGILDEILDDLGQSRLREEVHSRVKKVFISLTSQYLKSNPAKEVVGASALLSQLRSKVNVSLSIATGGWSETATMKLESASIDVIGIPMASSNDHFSRMEIMKIALKKGKVSSNISVNYIGDAEWDKKACRDLGFNFILVGNNIKHTQQVPDLSYQDRVFNYIGL